MQLPVSRALNRGRWQTAEAETTGCLTSLPNALTEYIAAEAEHKHAGGRTCRRFCSLWFLSSPCLVLACPFYTLWSSSSGGRGDEAHFSHASRLRGRQTLGLLWDVIFLPHGNYHTLGEQAALFTVSWLCIAASWWFLFRVWPARWWP